jgi:hypothetical protein
VPKRRKATQPTIPSEEFRPEFLPTDLLAETKSWPGKWVYEFDSRFNPDGAVPPEGIKRGAWKVGDDGVPTGEYKANPNYRRKSRRWLRRRGSDRGLHARSST